MVFNSYFLFNTDFHNIQLLFLANGIFTHHPLQNRYINYNLHETCFAILLSSLSVAKDLKMATHKTIPNEILRFTRE